MLAFSAAAPFAIVILPRRYEFACGTFGRTSLGPYCIATISGLANLALQPCHFNTVMPVRGPPCTGTQASLFPNRPPRVHYALRHYFPTYAKMCCGKEVLYNYSIRGSDYNSKKNNTNKRQNNNI